MFKDTQTVGNALGSALLAGFKLIVCIDNFLAFFCEEIYAPAILIIIFYLNQSPIGGKIIVLQSSLPNINPGALKAREDPKALGTPKVNSQIITIINYLMSI